MKDLPVLELLEAISQVLPLLTNLDFLYFSDLHPDADGEVSKKIAQHLKNKANFVEKITLANVSKSCFLNSE